MSERKREWGREEKREKEREIENEKEKSNEKDPCIVKRNRSWSCIPDSRAAWYC